MRAVSCPVVGGFDVVLSNIATPDEHFVSSPDCSVSGSRDRCVCDRCSCPTVDDRIVSAAGVEIVGIIVSTPNDHFSRAPYCRVVSSGGRRVGDAGGCPTIGIWVISPASV